MITKLKGWQYFSPFRLIFFAVLDSEMDWDKSKFETYHVVFVHRIVAVPLNLCIHALAKHPFLIQLKKFWRKKNETKQKKVEKISKQIELDEVKKTVCSHMLRADTHAVAKMPSANEFLRYIILSTSSPLY